MMEKKQVPVNKGNKDRCWSKSRKIEEEREKKGRLIKIPTRSRVLVNICEMNSEGNSDVSVIPQPHHNKVPRLPLDSRRGKKRTLQESNTPKILVMLTPQPRNSNNSSTEDGPDDSILISRLLRAPARYEIERVHNGREARRRFLAHRTGRTLESQKTLTLPQERDQKVRTQRLSNILSL